MIDILQAGDFLCCIKNKDESMRVFALSKGKKKCLLENEKVLYTEIPFSFETARALSEEIANLHGRGLGVYSLCDPDICAASFVVI